MEAPSMELFSRGRGGLRQQAGMEQVKNRTVDCKQYLNMHWVHLQSSLIQSFLYQPLKWKPHWRGFLAERGEACINGPVRSRLRTEQLTANNIQICIVFTCNLDWFSLLIPTPQMETPSMELFSRGRGGLRQQAGMEKVKNRTVDCKQYLNTHWVHLQPNLILSFLYQPLKWKPCTWSFLVQGGELASIGWYKNRTVDCVSINEIDPKNSIFDFCWSTLFAIRLT